MSKSVSLPATEINTRQARRKYWGWVFQLRFNNAALLFLTAACLVALVMNSQALHHSANAFRDFRPPVIVESVSGDARLIASQDLNFKNEDRVIRQALGKFALLHFDRMRVTVKANYNDSFIYLEDRLGKTIKMNDRTSNWLEKFLSTTSEPESQVVVNNVILKDVATPTDGQKNGYAEILCSRITYLSDQQPKPHEPSDDFIVTARWGIAATVDNRAVLTNPLGVAITFFRVDAATH